jgi:hypothetical protein
VVGARKGYRGGDGTRSLRASTTWPEGSVLWRRVKEWNKTNLYEIMAVKNTLKVRMMSVVEDVWREIGGSYGGCQAAFCSFYNTDPARPI